MYSALCARHKAGSWAINHKQKMDNAQPEGGPTVGTGGQAKRTGVRKQEGSLKEGSPPPPHRNSAGKLEHRPIIGNPSRFRGTQE